MQTANRKFKADSVGRRNEDRSLSGFVGAGRDALTLVWTVANHPNVVASLHDALTPVWTVANHPNVVASLHDALTPVWTVANHSNVVASLHELRR